MPPRKPHGAAGAEGMAMQVGQVLKAISGTRPISVTVVSVDSDGVRLRCNADWSFQGESEFALSHQRFASSVWATAEAA